MVRSLLILAGAVAALVPTVCAQNVTICVYQAQKGHKMHNDNDAQEVATALSALKLPNGNAIHAIPVEGISTDDESADAQKRSCNFVAEVWRTDLPENSPLYGGTLHPGSNIGQDTMDNANQMNRSDTDNTVMDYALRKTDSDKKIAHGEEDNNKPTSIADTMAKKLAREK